MSRNDDMWKTVWLQYMSKLCLKRHQTPANLINRASLIETSVAKPTNQKPFLNSFQSLIILCGLQNFRSCSEAAEMPVARQRVVYLIASAGQKKKKKILNVFYVFLPGALVTVSDKFHFLPAKHWQSFPRTSKLLCSHSSIWSSVTAM